MSNLYEPPEWETRQKFVRFIDDICAGRHISVTWLSDYWIASLEHGGVRQYLHGYVFPLNSAVAAGLMRDKVSTYAVLKHQGVPAIPHYLVRLPASRDTSRATGQALGLAPLPVVLKPDNSESGGGQDVFKCATRQELEATINNLASRYQTIAVSPYMELTAEYRVVVLDGKPKLIFEKVRQNDTWQHNLNLGAEPRLVGDPQLLNRLEPLAVHSMEAVQGRLASVDIVATPAGLQIMEINGGITLTSFSSRSAEYAHIAREVYDDIIEACFA